MKFIDDILNRISMYRLVLYYLIALVSLAVVFGALGILPYSPVALLFSTGLFILASSIANELFTRAFDVTPGTDSTLITALILVLIVTPILPTNLGGIVLIIFISFWAIGSKYLLALRKKHVFNPAAVGIALSALLVGQGATWWAAGNIPMLPLIVLGGLLIVRKIQRFDLVLSFAIASLLTIALTAHGAPLTSIQTTLTHSSFFFLAFVMLTEPATMPASRTMRVVYGFIAGALFAPAAHILSFYFTPETALLVANLFAFATTPHARRTLVLRERHKLADGTYEFVFAPDRPLHFTAGQYLEWTVPSTKDDRRGNRRYFTIASGPSEKNLRLGVKFYEPMSSFKRTLSALHPGDTVSVAHITGDFVLPSDPKEKVAFIAGGIGITPFRSMVGEMIATGEVRDAVLLYTNRREEDIAYRKVFDEVKSKGLRTVYTVTEGVPQSAEVQTGLIDAVMITREIPDYRNRTFYISGPRSMVLSFKKVLQEIGIPKSKIKTDYFPGFA